MKGKREEPSEKDETFNTSKVFSNFEDILHIFLMICIANNISRNVGSMFWDLLKNQSVANIIQNYENEIFTYPTYLKKYREDSNLPEINMAATYRLPSKELRQIE